MFGPTVTLARLEQLYAGDVVPVHAVLEEAKVFPVGFSDSFFDVGNHIYPTLEATSAINQYLSDREATAAEVQQAATEQSLRATAHECRLRRAGGNPPTAHSHRARLVETLEDRTGHSARL